MLSKRSHSKQFTNLAHPGGGSDELGSRVLAWRRRMPGLERPSSHKLSGKAMS
jgi:hypothetical protein